MSEKKGHTANGTYVMPMKQIDEFVKVMLGKPVNYIFAEKAEGRVHYYTKRVR
jgi:hypothetical protein